MSWRASNHFSLFLFPSKSDSEKLKTAMQTLHSRFSDTVLPPPENDEVPIRICNFPFPIPVEGEPYADTLEKQLGDYYAHARLGGYPVRKVCMKPDRFYQEGDSLFLTLAPVTEHDERRLVQITDRVRSRFACDICSPTVLFAQLHPGFCFPAGHTEILQEILSTLDFEILADMHTLSLVLRYSANAANNCGKSIT